MKKMFFSLVAIVLCAAVFTGCKDDDNDPNAPLVAITLSETSKILKPADVFNLTVNFFPVNAGNKELEWTSDDESVATVDSEGKVTAHSEGTATIKATAKSNTTIYAECFVTVTLDDFGTQSGAVEGVWTKHSVVFVNDQIWVEKGKSLTVEEGVTIIIQDGPVGESGAPIEFFVDGNLYMKGSKEYPILVTVAENKRTEANRYAGLWGGFVGGDNCAEMLFDNVIIEYTGAMVKATSQSVIAGFNVADDDKTAQILTNNTESKIVVINSTFRYANSDAMYFMGGRAIVANNLVHTIGETDNDGINMKAGVQVDIAYNLTFAVNSNALKLSSSGESPARRQARIRAFNNTIVNSGWRRMKNTKGGSIFVEKNASASVYNNLIVNSKFMTKTPKWNQPDPSNGAHHSSIIDYNFYASGSQSTANTLDPNLYPTAFAGYTFPDGDYWHDGRNGTTIVDGNSLVATSAGTPDPNFVNFGFNTVALDRDMYDASWDFRVQAGSPVLVGSGGKQPRNDFSGSFAPFFGATGLTVGGVEYKTPAPSPRYGAFGTN